MAIADNFKNIFDTASKAQDKGREEAERIVYILRNTLKFGMTAGISGIVFYAFHAPQYFFKTISLFLLLGAASYVSGFFLGFLFGIPKRNAESETDYNLSNNLVDISDWLTKIIIGLGLIEIKTIPGHLESIGIYIMNATGRSDQSVKVFSIFAVVYFSIFGIYYGYNYMRLFLSGLYKGADDNLLKNQEELTEKEKILTSKNISFSTQMDDTTQKNLADYDQLLKITKTEAEYTFTDWYYKGVAAYNNKEYEKMIVYMQKALEKDRNADFAADANLYLSLAYNALRLNEKAIESNNNIINNYPGYAYQYLAHYNNGIFYDELANYEKALEQYELSLQKNPNYSLAWNNKGNILLKLKRYEDAMPAFDKAIELDPGSHYPWYNKAYIYAINDQKESVIDNLQKAISLHPEYKATAAREGVFQKYLNDENFKALLA